MPPRHSVPGLASLILAVRFLTILPVPGQEAVGPNALGRAAWWFPIVGFAIGAALVAVDSALAALFPPGLAAVLAVACWKILTGGLHLDGLADCLDGLGGADVERRLAIMRDSRVGVFGVVGLIFCVLAAVASLGATPSWARARMLFVAPGVGRIAPLLVGLGFGPATPDRGVGARFLVAIPRWAGPIHLGLALGLAALLLGWPGAAMVAGSLALAFAWSSFVARRLGGITGDVLGAAVELGELLMLLAGASFAHVGLLR